jgi:hypothetical protein
MVALTWPNTRYVPMVVCRFCDRQAVPLMRLFHWSMVAFLRLCAKLFCLAVLHLDFYSQMALQAPPISSIAAPRGDKNYQNSGLSQNLKYRLVTPSRASSFFPPLSPFPHPYSQRILSFSNSHLGDIEVSEARLVNPSSPIH